MFTYYLNMVGGFTIIVRVKIYQILRCNHKLIFKTLINKRLQLI